MAFEFFIANRIRSSGNKKSFSRFIIHLAVASIAVGLAVMIVSSAMVRGFKKDVSQKIYDFWGHIRITSSFTNQSSYPDPINYDSSIVDSLYTIASISYQPDGYPEFKSKGGVSHVQSYIQYPCVLSTKEDFEGVFIRGISNDFNPSFFRDYLQEGTIIPVGDSLVSRDIIISNYTANRLQLKLDDRIRLHVPIEGRQIMRQFKVSGIYNTGLLEYDDKIAFVDIRALRQILRWDSDKIGGLEVFVEHIDDADLINEYIYNEILPSDQYSDSIKSSYRNIFIWLELQDVNERIILGLMLIVVLINMCTTLLILVLERSFMIGTLRSMGAKNWSIRKIFVIQASHILLKGLFYGNLIGLGFCLLQEKFRFIKLKESDYYLSYAPIELNFLVVLAINFVVLLVTIFVLIGPTYLINKLSITRTLRFT